MTTFVAAPPLRVRTELVNEPLVTEYRYARATDTTCTLARVSISDGRHVGHGEGSPFMSFFDSDVSATHSALASARVALESGEEPRNVIAKVTDMPTRNALEGAWIDYLAKARRMSAAGILGIDAPGPQVVMTTIAMGDLDVVEQDLRRTRRHPLLKLKLGSFNDNARISRLRDVRPDARLVVDVNGGWDLTELEAMMPILVEANTEMIEQPLPPDADQLLGTFQSPIPLIADESFNGPSDFADIVGRFDGVNIKLDKCGGITAALGCVARARELGLHIMVGCLPASSLSSAVGIHVAQYAKWIDLDNHLWMRNDYSPAISYLDGTLQPPTPELWG